MLRSSRFARAGGAQEPFALAAREETTGRTKLAELIAVHQIGSRPIRPMECGLSIGAGRDFEEVGWCRIVLWCGRSFRPSSFARSVYPLWEMPGSGGTQSRGMKAAVP